MNIIGSSIIELSTVPSTNNYAAELIRQTNVQNGTVILAHEQTAGRGQRGRIWHSSSGVDLTFSIILFPEELGTDKQFYLSRAIALGVRDHLENLLKKEVFIKWPNDIFIGDKKICGILIENEVSGNALGQSIIGIGLNVAFSDNSMDFMYTSLKKEMGLLPDRTELLKNCLASLNKRYQELLANRYSRLARDHYNALYKKEEWAEFDLRGEVVRAKILDVENDGRLIIELEDGSVTSEGTDTLRHIVYGTDISDQRSN